MPKISDERRTERREQILEGARRCFAEHGYEGATVVRLEREIGLSRGAIFNYFPSKEDLFVELAVRDNARMSEVWVNDGLEGVVREVVELDPAWLSVYLELFRRVRTDPGFRGRIEERQKEFAPANRARIEEAQRNGEFRDDIAPKDSARSSISCSTASLCSVPATTSFRARSSCSRSWTTLSAPELVGVRLRVHAPDALDLVDVRPRLREGDPTALREPAVDVPLARVVGGEREPQVAVVVVAQVVEVPGAIAHVDLRIAEIGDDEPRPARAERDALGRLRKQLHQPDRAGGGLDVRVEAALGVDDRREERRVEVVVSRVRPDDVLVLERVARAEVPVRLGVDDPRGGTREREQRKGDRDEVPHETTSVRTPGSG